MELRGILTNAFEQSPIVRVIGSHDRDKSQAVSERIRWLIEHNARPESICVLSHTMQMLRILRYAMAEYIGESDSKQAEYVRFTTAHYLARQISSITEHGNLPEFKYDPTIQEWELRELKEENCLHLIDTWEAREMLDAELAAETGWPRQRCREIRESCEALWCTGESTPPNYDAPSCPVSGEEQAAFSEFLPGREKFYVYAVQGRHIRTALQQCESGGLEPAKLADTKHLIVDEYQDLNPVEIEFIDKFIASAESAFVIGDPDECVGWAITATRFSWPQGFEEFPKRHPDCFTVTLPLQSGCHPLLLDAAEPLLQVSEDDEVLTDNSLTVSSEAGLKGASRLAVWQFDTSAEEAEVIAESCRRLTEAGLPAHEILILLPDDDIPCQALLNSLEAVQIPFLHPDKMPYLENDESHFIVAFFDVAWLKYDYIACGSFLTMMTGSEYDTQTRLVSNAVKHNLRVEDLMSKPLPTGIFDEEEMKLIEKVKELVSHLQAIDGNDALANTRADLGKLAGQYLGPNQEDIWMRDSTLFPEDSSLAEVKYCIVADDLYQWERMFEAIFEHRGRSVIRPEQVRMCRTRLARGASAGVVFVPGLEESRVPDKTRSKYPLLLKESARRLRHAITRARQTCILSYAKSSDAYGSGQAPCRFLQSIAPSCEARASALTTEEIRAVLET